MAAGDARRESYVRASESGRMLPSLVDVPAAARIKPGRGPLLEDWLRKRDEDWVHEVSGFHAKNTRRIDRDL